MKVKFCYSVPITSLTTRIWKHVAAPSLFDLFM